LFIYFKISGCFYRNGKEKFEELVVLWTRLSTGVTLEVFSKQFSTSYSMFLEMEV
jgi:hypothetical protein